MTLSPRTRRALSLLVGLPVLAILTLVLSWPTARYLRPVRALLAAPAVGRLAIRGVHVRTLSGDDTVLGDQTALLAEGRILGFQAADLIIPPGFEVLEGEGRFLVPGLIDTHAHVFDESDLVRLLAHGVTSVRNMMGLPVHLLWRAALAEGRLAGPRLVTASPVLNGPGGYPLHHRVDTADEARAAVRAFRQAGYDFVKVYDRLDADTYLAAADEAARVGLAHAGHLPAAIPLDRLLASRPASIEHVEELFQSPLDGEMDERRAREVARQISAAGVPVVATLTVFRQIVQACNSKAAFVDSLPDAAQNPVIEFMGRKPLEAWAARPSSECAALQERARFFDRLVKILDEEGVTVVVGTDAGPLRTVPGPSLHRELELLAQAGLSRSRILGGATRDAARVLGLGQETGTLEVGKRADLLLVDEDPELSLATLARPRAVISGGRLYREADLVRLQEAGRQHASVYVTVGRLLEGAW